MDKIAEIIKQTKAYYCLDCGKCTGNCPVSLFDESYSPRVMVKSVLLGEGQKLGQSRLNDDDGPCAAHPIAARHDRQDLFLQAVPLDLLLQSPADMKGPVGYAPRAGADHQVQTVRAHL
ncbi:hypothetical protein ACFL0G_02740 [Candidatus Zixiibacteriota bacterium]